MRMIAVRIEDELADRLRAVAELEGTTQIEQIREAIYSHISKKIASGDITERAQKALDKIDAEVTTKRRAIASLLAAGSTDPITEPNDLGDRACLGSDGRRLNPED